MKGEFQLKEQMVDAKVQEVSHTKKEGSTAPLEKQLLTGLSSLFSTGDIAQSETVDTGELKRKVILPDGTIVTVPAHDLSNADYNANGERIRTDNNGKAYQRFNGESPFSLSNLESDHSTSLSIDGKKFDAPLSKDVKLDTEAKIEEKRMIEQITVEFKCPQGMDKKEFTRQLKEQERGLNSMTVKRWIDNRERFKARAEATGNGRSPEGYEAQRIQREKDFQSRIESNQKKGLSYSEAKQEASQWISKQAALHNPDQIAGGDPSKVDRMGDAGVNSSIGSQWKSKIGAMEALIKTAASKMSPEELAKTKLNVKLIVEV